MCGIIISRHSDRLRLIDHRGLESGVTERHGFFIGHRRLPIQTELGDGYGQPIELPGGDILLYNGEIFNYPKGYKNDVEYLTHLFMDNSVTRVLEIANHWDGFWSIVFITRYGTMYCFTDPLGKKQLYYNHLGEICSEITPLVYHEKDYDEVFKSEVFKWGYNTDDRTPWNHVKRMMPNHLYVFSSGHLMNYIPSEYFSWDIQSDKGLKNLLIESVDRRTMALNQKLGVLLSGGLDSSIIAVILKQLGKDVTFYTVDNDSRDLECAKLLADRLGVDLHYLDYEVTPKTLRDCLSWNETPIDLGSVIPSQLILGEVKERVVLTGDGADELFGGYRRIDDYDSQKSDVFHELPFYHMPRLDRASMRHTIELRNPFLGHDVVRYALRLPFPERYHKACLKKMFADDLPEEILNRPKEPLKNPELKRDPLEYRKKVFETFYK